MNELTLFVSALVLAGLLTYVLGPLLGRPRSIEPEADEARRPRAVQALEERKAMIYQSIRDAELDRQTGKLSQEDYEEMVRGLKAEAVEVLKSLDGATGGKAEE